MNCAAVPESLLESELFGHEKGAFTGADRRRDGLFAAASGGTLFLDEIGDMPLATQAKLLRVLQDRAVRPLGGTASVQLDLRIVAATNKDLPAMVRDGRFREDLYYRLAVIPIRLPSLRERPEDIMLIAEHFLRETAARLGKAVEGFDETAVQWMERHAWPGNVRELENVVERAVVLAHASKITRDDLGTEFTLDAAHSPLRPTLATLEGEYVRRVLDEVRGRQGGGREDSRRLGAHAPAPIQGALRGEAGSPSPAHRGTRAPPRRPAMTGCRAGDRLSRVARRAAPDAATQPAESRAFPETCRARAPVGPVVRSLQSREGHMADQRPTSPDPGHRPSVMIVDDDAEMRALLRDALERDGFDVREDSGGQLVPLLERRAPDAIVLDKEMAGVNGLDLLSYIRQRHPGIPVIVVTAFGGTEVEAEALKTRRDVLHRQAVSGGPTAGHVAGRARPGRPRGGRRWAEYGR